MWLFSHVIWSSYFFCWFCSPKFMSLILVSFWKSIENRSPSFRKAATMAKLLDMGNLNIDIMQLILAAHPEKLKMTAVKSQFTIKHLTEPYQHGNHWEPRNMVVEPYKCITSEAAWFDPFQGMMPFATPIRKMKHLKKTHRCHRVAPTNCRQIIPKRPKGGIGWKWMINHIPVISNNPHRLWYSSAIFTYLGPFTACLILDGWDYTYTCSVYVYIIYYIHYNPLSTIHIHLVSFFCPLATIFNHYNFANFPPRR